MLLLVIYNASRPHIAVLARVPGSPGAFADIARHPAYESIPDLLILRLDSPLMYANATLVRDRVKYLVGASDPLPRAVVLDIGVSDELDISSTEVLEQLVDALRAAGIDFALTDVRQSVTRRMRRSGLLEKIGSDQIHLTVDDAIHSFNLASDRVEPRIGDSR
jgi:SulP family sulfate permease